MKPACPRTPETLNLLTPCEPNQLYFTNEEKSPSQVTRVPVYPQKIPSLKWYQSSLVNEQHSALSVMLDIINALGLEHLGFLKSLGYMVCWSLGLLDLLWMSSGVF
ncbi:hypothetical protein AVEN_153046-1 [Araneus ventricosus]|uniref:Uncharacterized protein n=1 Tax=Araneus ventricosus TaxID=182803 RepID=A0A4Y2MVZ4_ARAVE|nr:hypothetical protein AVEN_153046-1 [Araneus ventricosus]